MRDRCDYRAMPERELIKIALNEGVDAEMAIVAVEKLSGPRHKGQFRFNHQPKEMTK